MQESWRAALGARAHAQLAGNLGYRRLGSVLRMRGSDAMRCELLRCSARTIAHLALDVMKMQADLPDQCDRCKQATLWRRRQGSASANADAARRTRASPTLGRSARAAACVRPACGLSPSGGLRCPIRSGRSLRHARASGGRPACARVCAEATGRPRRTQQQIEILELPVHYALKRVRLQPSTHSRAERTQAHSAIAQPRPLRYATTHTGATVEPLREPLRVDRCAVRRGDRCKCACLLLREV